MIRECERESYIKEPALRKALDEKSPAYRKMTRVEQTIVIEKIKRVADATVEDEIRLLNRVRA